MEKYYIKRIRYLLFKQIDYGSTKSNSIIRRLYVNCDELTFEIIYNNIRDTILKKIIISDRQELIDLYVFMKENPTRLYTDLIINNLEDRIQELQIRKKEFEEKRRKIDGN